MPTNDGNFYKASTQIIASFELFERITCPDITDGTIWDIARIGHIPLEGHLHFYESISYPCNIQTLFLCDLGKPIQIDAIYDVLPSTTALNNRADLDFSSSSIIGPFYRRKICNQGHLRLGYDSSLLMNRLLELCDTLSRYSTCEQKQYILKSTFPDGLIYCIQSTYFSCPSCLLLWRWRTGETCTEWR